MCVRKGTTNHVYLIYTFIPYVQIAKKERKEEDGARREEEKVFLHYNGEKGKKVRRGRWGEQQIKVKGGQVNSQ